MRRIPTIVVTPIERPKVSNPVPPGGWPRLHCIPVVLCSRTRFGAFWLVISGLFFPLCTPPRLAPPALPSQTLQATARSCSFLTRHTHCLSTPLVMHGTRAWPEADARRAVCWFCNRGFWRPRANVCCPSVCLFKHVFRSSPPWKKDKWTTLNDASRA